MSKEAIITFFEPAMGRHFTFKVSAEDAVRLKTDMTFAQRLINSQVEMENDYLSKANIILPLEDPIVSETMEHPVMSENIEDPTMNENIVSNAPDHRKEKEKKCWGYDDTLLLITSVETHYEEFTHPKKKKYVWKTVADELNSHGVNVTSTECNKKWTNLVRTYKSCKDIKEKTGRGPHRFNFFSQMDNFLGTEPSNCSPHSIDVQNKIREIQPGPTDTSEAINETHSNIDENKKENIEPATSGTLNENDQEIIGSNTKKRRRNATLDYFKAKKQYLEQKQQKIMEHKQENEKKMNLLERKLELEERKVAAIENLLNLKKQQAGNLG